MRLIAAMVIGSAILTGCVNPQAQAERQKVRPQVVAELQETLRQVFPHCIAAAQGRGFDAEALKKLGFNKKSLSGPGGFAKVLSPSFRSGIVGNAQQHVSLTMNPLSLIGRQGGCTIELYADNFGLYSETSDPIIAEFLKAGYVPEIINRGVFVMKKGDQKVGLSVTLKRLQSSSWMEIIIS